MKTNALLICFVCALAACAQENETVPLQHQPYEAAAGVPLSCVPNLDGVIEARELAPSLNQTVSFIVSPPLPSGSPGLPINLAGMDANGKKVWNWSADTSTDMVASFSAQELSTRWFAAQFPGGQFVLPADLSGSLEGVYSYDETALRLHGVASSSENPPEGKTLLPYEQPVDFFPFPLEPGKSWSQTGVVMNGTLKGVTPWSQDDVYECAVEGAGELRLPDFTFTMAMRVNIKVNVKPKAGSQQGYTQRQAVFVNECFGEVARATSVLLMPGDADPGPDFPFAVETRKLGWF